MPKYVFVLYIKKNYYSYNYFGVQFVFILLAMQAKHLQQLSFVNRKGNSYYLILKPTLDVQNHDIH